MQATDPVKWVRIMDADDVDEVDAIDVCFYCAATATDESFRTVVMEVDADLLDLLAEHELLTCALCGVELAP